MRLAAVTWTATIIVAALAKSPPRLLPLNEDDTIAVDVDKLIAPPPTSDYQNDEDEFDRAYPEYFESVEESPDGCCDDDETAGETTTKPAETPPTAKSVDETTTREGTTVATAEASAFTPEVPESAAQIKDTTAVSDYPDSFEKHTPKEDGCCDETTTNGEETVEGSQSTEVNSQQSTVVDGRPTQSTEMPRTTVEAASFTPEAPESAAQIKDTTAVSDYPDSFEKHTPKEDGCCDETTTNGEETVEGSQSTEVNSQQSTLGSESTPSTAVPKTSVEQLGTTTETATGISSNSETTTLQSDDDTVTDGPSEKETTSIGLTSADFSSTVVSVEITPVKPEVDSQILETTTSKFSSLPTTGSTETEKPPQTSETPPQTSETPPQTSKRTTVISDSETTGSADGETTTSTAEQTISDINETGGPTSTSETTKTSSEQAEGSSTALEETNAPGLPTPLPSHGVETPQPPSIPTPVPSIEDKDYPDYFAKLQPDKEACCDDKEDGKGKPVVEPGRPKPIIEPENIIDPNPLVDPKPKPIIEPKPIVEPKPIIEPKPEVEPSVDPPTCDRCHQCQLCHSCAECVTNGSRYSCRCRAGFVGDGYECVEDDCTTKSCGPDATCQSRYWHTGNDRRLQVAMGCVCRRRGQIWDEEGQRCTDDPCSSTKCKVRCIVTESGTAKCVGEQADIRHPCASPDTHNCHANADCIPKLVKQVFDQLERAYVCRCMDGFEGNGTVCYEDPCLNQPCGHNRECLSFGNGQFECVCGQGRYLDGIDDCVKHPCFESSNPCGLNSVCIPAHAATTHLYDAEFTCVADEQTEHVVEVLGRKLLPQNARCPPTHYACRDFDECIPLSRVLDRVFDCPDGDDEDPAQHNLCALADRPCDPQYGECVWDSDNYSVRCICAPGYRLQGSSTTCVKGAAGPVDFQAEEYQDLFDMLDCLSNHVESLSLESNDRKKRYDPDIVCSCPTGQVKGVDGSCVAAPTANIEVRIKSICGTAAAFRPEYSDPDSIEFQLITTIMGEGIQHVLRNQSIAKSVCIPPKSLRAGSVVTGLSVECTSNDTCNATNISDALTNSPLVDVDPSSITGISCTLQEVCSENALCIEEGLSFRCVCLEGYMDESVWVAGTVCEAECGSFSMSLRSCRTRLFNIGYVVFGLLLVALIAFIVWRRMKRGKKQNNLFQPHRRRSSVHPIAAPSPPTPPLPTQKPPAQHEVDIYQEEPLKYRKQSRVVSFLSPAEFGFGALRPYSTKGFGVPTLPEVGEPGDRGSVPDIHASLHPSVHRGDTQVFHRRRATLPANTRPMASDRIEELPHEENIE